MVCPPLEPNPGCATAGNIEYFKKYKEIRLYYHKELVTNREKHETSLLSSKNNSKFFSYIKNNMCTKDTRYISEKSNMIVSETDCSQRI